MEMEEVLIDFTTFEGFKKYCEIMKVPAEIINNPAFEQFYNSKRTVISLVDKKIVSESTGLLQDFRDNDSKKATVFADSSAVVVSYSESQKNYDYSVDDKYVCDVVKLNNGNFIITEDYTYSRTPADYQAQISGFGTKVVSTYDNFGVETVNDYYSHDFSHDRNHPFSYIITDVNYADTHSRLERKYFNVATYFEFDQKNHEVKNKYTVPLSGENGYSKIVVSNNTSSNDILNYLDENIVGFLTPEEINARLEKEANPVVREGLKAKFVNGREQYSYIPSHDKDLILNGQNLQEVLADRMIQQMENNKIDAMGNPITPSGINNNNTRTMGFGGMWLIGLITGIMSCGIILLGIFLK